MAAKIVVVGSLNMDLIGQSPRIPTPGETVIGHHFSTAAGGKGANQAVAAARLGAQVTMVGCVGNDEYGNTLIQRLQGDSVDTQFVRRDDEAHTGIAIIQVSDDGENSILVISGANWQLTQEDIAQANQTIAQADLLMLQLEVPLNVVEYAVQTAVSHNVPILLNPAPARQLPKSLLSTITYLTPNESEAALLTKLSIAGMASVKTAVSQLKQTGIDNIIVTLGSRGAFLSTKDEELHIPAFEVTVIDTTAAGDAFNAGFGVAVAEKRPLAQAVRFAAAAGALATTKLGAQPSLPTRAEVIQIMADS